VTFWRKALIIRMSTYSRFTQQPLLESDILLALSHKCWVADILYWIAYIPSKATFRWNSSKPKGILSIILVTKKAW
jgi:hypothetical protein